MAAPTSTNEVTARRLASVISQLWEKIKGSFVSKTGDETIAGEKTFTGAIEIKYGSCPQLIITSTSANNTDERSISCQSDNNGRARVIEKTSSGESAIISYSNGTYNFSGTATKATKFSQGYGSSTQPIYIQSDGTPAVCSSSGISVDNAVNAEYASNAKANSNLAKQIGAKADDSAVVHKAGDTMTGSLNMRAPSGESSVKVFKAGSTGDSAQRIDLFFGSDGSRGLWDKTNGDIIAISDTDAYFHGVADTSVWSGGANRLNLSEWAYSGNALSSESTRILELGYLTLNHTYQHIELLFTSGFYGNQHYSSDLIHIFADKIGSASSTHNVVVGRSMLMQRSATAKRTFYALLDGDNNRLYIYVHIGSAGNGYGKWNVSVLGSNVGTNKNDCVWTQTWATEIPKGDAMAEVPITGSVNKSSTSDLATTATNYSATGGIATALEGKQSTLPIKDSIYQIGVLSSLNSGNAVEANKSHCDGGGNNIMGSYGASIDIVNTNVLQLINMNGEVISTKTLPYTAVVFNQTGSAENVLYCL